MMTQYSLQIQLEFENPIEISQTIKPDWLEIVFKCPYFFVSVDLQGLADAEQDNRIVIQESSKLPQEIVR